MSRNSLPAALVLIQTSGPITISNAGDIDFDHSLGIPPKLVEFFLVMTAAQLGYAVGDEIPVANQNGFGARATDKKVSGTFNNTATPFALRNAGTGASGNLTNGNAKFYVRVYG